MVIHCGLIIVLVNKYSTTSTLFYTCNLCSSTLLTSIVGDLIFSFYYIIENWLGLQWGRFWWIIALLFFLVFSWTSSSDFLIRAFIFILKVSRSHLQSNKGKLFHSARALMLSISHWRLNMLNDNIWFNSCSH